MRGGGKMGAGGAPGEESYLATLKIGFTTLPQASPCQHPRKSIVAVTIERSTMSEKVCVNE